MDGLHNQLHLYETIAENIKNQIHGGVFSQGGLDENVSFCFSVQTTLVANRLFLE
jgi:hypothetical protein